jgi:hypothetical protein
MQKFLEKLNYLRRFISNLWGRLVHLLLYFGLKNEAKFTWGRGGQINDAPLMTTKSTCLHRR